LCDKFQCPGLVLTDLLISEGTASVDPKDLDFKPKIDRGELILPDSNGNGNGNGAANPFGGYNDNAYLRYKFTESGISPRAVPGTPGHIHIAATDEHDQDGTLISDEFTNPTIRRQMVEKRARKMEAVLSHIAPPKLVGPESAAVTLVGWGSTESLIHEAVEKLAAEEGIVANQLAVKWIVPFHADEISHILSHSKKIIISRGICAPKPASPRTDTSASTTANRSCRITSSRPSRSSLPARPNFPSRNTKSTFKENHDTSR
jgi:2-oxoglutarate ferredoxin oxidoreductase subunit alpha